MMNQDIFGEINNAVLDLQNSQLQTYERPLKKLAQLLGHAVLEPYNKELTKEVDLDTFIAESEKSGRGMVGSAQLAWPDDQKKTMGLTLLLIGKLASDPSYAINFSHHFFIPGEKSLLESMRLLVNSSYPLFVITRTMSSRRGVRKLC